MIDKIRLIEEKRKRYLLKIFLKNSVSINIIYND